jgi:Peptidase A4 family
MRNVYTNISWFALAATLPIASLMSSTVLADPPTANSVPTNLPGVTANLAPPSGFDPLAASAAELRARNLPPRPDRNASPAGYDRWAHIMTSGAKWVVPTLEKTNIFHGPVKIAKSSKVVNSQASTDSYNWSGDAIVTPYKGLISSNFYFLFGDYVIPNVRQPLGTCSGSWDYSSEWVGIDGFDSNDVLQAGVEADAYCSGTTTASFYSAWWEWYPYSEVRISASSFPVSPGDDLFVEVWSTSQTAGHVLLYNYNTNVAVVVNFTPPTGTLLQGNSAEWVVERPAVGGALATLPGYSLDFFADTSAYDFNDDLYTPGQPGSWTNYDITMVNSNGDPLSEAFPSLNSIFFEAVGDAE